MTYQSDVHTIVETPEYLVAASWAGMTDDERYDAIMIISESSEAGDIIPGSGGARKVRIAKQGKGKEEDTGSLPIISMKKRLCSSSRQSAKASNPI